MGKGIIWMSQCPLVEGEKSPERESAVSHQKPTLEAAGEVTPLS